MEIAIKIWLTIASNPHHNYDLPFLKQYCQRIVSILESESDEEGK